PPAWAADSCPGRRAQKKRSRKYTQPTAAAATTVRKKMTTIGHCERCAGGAGGGAGFGFGGALVGPGAFLAARSGLLPGPAGAGAFLSEPGPSGDTGSGGRLAVLGPERLIVPGPDRLGAPE